MSLALATKAVALGEKFVLKSTFFSSAHCQFVAIVVSCSLIRLTTAYLSRFSLSYFCWEAEHDRHPQ
ncbi:MAG: hypothetical protein HLUCCA11_24295 [Phormidesmis priestleyi Ana]|uniref:Uncharacterized protein n=1 Tax=Phormidesmis priestleyi Ana TaxID=1666911 RepID=A0A0P7YN72_9CYAN|nr:MAG: hypothetical protein HLUCCA11_24295 [Phormidesmis priestleyi Ana]